MTFSVQFALRPKAYIHDQALQEKMAISRTKNGYFFQTSTMKVNCRKQKKKTVAVEVAPIFCHVVNVCRRCPITSVSSAVLDRWYCSHGLNLVMHCNTRCFGSNTHLTNHCNTLHTHARTPKCFCFICITQLSSPLHSTKGQQRENRHGIGLHQ